MSNQCLNGLAMMHVHYKRTVDICDVVDRFARRNKRKMQFVDILDDGQCRLQESLQINHDGPVFVRD